MVNYEQNEPPTYLTILSFGVSGFLICMGVSTVKAQHYRVEYEQFRLEVGTVLSTVKAASDTLQYTAETSTIAPQDKREIQQLTQKSSAVIEQIQSEIDQQTDKL